MSQAPGTTQVTPPVEPKETTNAPAPKEQTPPPVEPIKVETSDPPKPKEQEPPAKDTPKTEPVVPEKYELKLPEGSLLTDQDLEQLSVHAKEKKLTQAQAEEVLAERHAAVSAFAERHQAQQQAEVQTKAKAWKEEIETDKEIGGTNLEQSNAYVTAAVKRFAPPDLQQIMSTSDIGKHPGLFRMLRSIGKAMADDDFVQDGPAPAGEKSLTELFYGPNKTDE